MQRAATVFALALCLTNTACALQIRCEFISGARAQTKNGVFVTQGSVLRLVCSWTTSGAKPSWSIRPEGAVSVFEENPGQKLSGHCVNLLLVAKAPGESVFCFNVAYGRQQLKIVVLEEVASKVTSGPEIAVRVHTTDGVVDPGKVGIVHLRLGKPFLIRLDFAEPKPVTQRVHIDATVKGLVAAVAARRTDRSMGILLFAEKEGETAITVSTEGVTFLINVVIAKELDEA